MTPALFGRIRQALEVLLDFFNADDKGLLMKEMNTELYMVSDECSLMVEYCVLNMNVMVHTVLLCMSKE